MTDFTRYLTDDIAKIAEEVHPYANDMFPSLLVKAVEQMINNDGLDLGEHLDTILQHFILYRQEGKKVPIKPLMEATNKQDFKWVLYDKCVAFCERENIEYVGNGGCFYHEKDIKMPQTMAQAVAWFTVAEMKDYLREYEQKVSGKRAEIEQRMIEHVPLSDLHTDLLIKYDDKVRQAYYGYLCNKYELLVRFVMFRAYHLKRLGQSYYQYKIIPRKGNMERMNNDEKALADEVSEGGYDTVFIDGKLAKLLPLFPSSSFDITTETPTPHLTENYKNKKKPNIIKRLFSSLTK